MKKIQFHRIWFGGNKIPNKYQDFWLAWQRQFPNCIFKTWTDIDLSELNLTSNLIKRADGYARKADIARYEILHRFGGIYLDCDMQPYHYFDPSELAAQLTVCNEDEDSSYCSIGFIAAPKEMPIFMDLINHIKSIELNSTAPNIETGPHLFGMMLKKHPHKILPVDSFYPYHFSKPYSTIYKKDLSQTFGIHVWGGSWLSDNEKNSKYQNFLDQGDLNDFQLQSDFENDQPHNSVNAKLSKKIDNIKMLRQAAIDCLLQNDFTNFIEFNPKDDALDLLKTSFYLLSENKDAIVWQFGAADGVLVDPIRTAIINYDPNAVLIEPNPYMFQRLQKNYSKNKNINFINLAYSNDTSNIFINCINPSKVLDNLLPDWVLGLSSAFNDRNAIGGLTVDSDTQEKISKCIEKMQIKTISLESLLDIYKRKHPDIVIIDIEGMDFSVVDDIIKNNIRPLIIQFEVQCMLEAERKNLIGLLKDEYLIVPQGNDWIAYRADFIVDYYIKLYVNHGIIGPFSKFIKYTFRN